MEVIDILITGARIIRTDDDVWSVYYKDQLIKTHVNKALALCHALSQEDLDIHFKEQYQKIA